MPREQVLQLQAYLRRCVNEVEGYLAADDIDGANDYMNRVRAEGGQGCHDLVLDAVARRRGQAQWRMFIPDTRDGQL